MRRVRLKYVANVIMGQSPASEDVTNVDTGVPFLQGNAEFGTRYPNAKAYCNVSPKKAIAGDLLLSVRAPVGAMNFADREYGIGRGLCAIRVTPSKLERRFAAYSIAAHIDDLKSVAVGSTYDAVTTSDVGALEITYDEDLDAQVTIAEFLDDETAEADALVAKYERLIELLEEKRVALITQAVTKGLDPGVSVRDSGIPSIGPLPSHWDVGPLKRFFTVLDGKRIPLSSEERSSRHGPYPYYGASGVIDCIDDYIFDESLVLVGEDGANLVNRTTPLAFVAHGKYWVNNHAHILRPIQYDSLDFWAQRIEVESVAPIVTGSAQPKLTIEALRSLVISAPPSESERRDISAYIDRVTAETRMITVSIARAIALAKEHRSALITAAVTGQMNVTSYRSTKKRIGVSA